MDRIVTKRDIVDHAILNNSNLSGWDLSYMTMRYVDLNHATLIRTDLSGANLTKGYLAGTNLSKANLRNACLDRTCPTQRRSHASRPSGLYV